MWEQIKSSITFADVLKVIIGFITGIILVISIYFTFEFRVKKVEEGQQEMNQRMLNYNKRLQNKINQDNDQWEGFKDRMDRRYVEQKEFDNFKDEWTWRFTKMDKNIETLIRLHMEGSRIRSIPDVPVGNQEK